MLSKAYDLLKVIDEEENNHLKRAEQNSIFVISTLLDNELTQTYSHSYFPFSLIYQNEFITESITPVTPILISRSSTAVTLKLPPYKAKISPEQS